MTRQQLKEEFAKAQAYCELKKIKTVKEFKQLIIKK